jgi:membrane fusion protein (multidrug efflux system)
LPKPQLELHSQEGSFAFSVGTYITPAILVANLVNIGKLKITFSIPEKYANQIKKNTVLSFKVSGSTEKYSANLCHRTFR